MTFNVASYFQSDEEKAKEEDEIKSQASDWSSSVFGRNLDERSPGPAIFLIDFFPIYFPTRALTSMFAS